MKQGIRDSVAAFVIQFTTSSFESGVAEEREREAFLDAHTPQWHLQARALVDTNLDMSIIVLIRTLCEIVGSNQGDVMELGVVDSAEKSLEYEMAQFNDWGRISMLSSFDSMRQLLKTLNEALPKNFFLRKWLRTKLRKEEGHGRYGSGGRADFRGKRRGGYRGRGGRQGGRPLGNRQFEVEAEVEDVMGDIEVTSEASKEVVPGYQMLDVSGENDSGQPVIPTTSEMSAPSFKRHSLHVKKASIS